MIKLEDIQIGDEVTVQVGEGGWFLVVARVEGDERSRWVNIEGDDCLITVLNPAGFWEATGFPVIGHTPAMF